MPSRPLRNRLTVYESDDDQIYLPPPVTRPKRPRTFFQKPATPFNPTALKPPNPRAPSMVAAENSAMNSPRPRNSQAPSMVAADSSAIVTNSPQPRNPRAPSMVAADSVDSPATNPPRLDQRATTQPAPKIREALVPVPTPGIPEARPPIPPSPSHSWRRRPFSYTSPATTPTSVSPKTGKQSPRTSKHIFPLGVLRLSRRSEKS
ncbi:hypothetical protein RUND412_000945 [Rhizina undulata]